MRRQRISRTDPQTMAIAAKQAFLEWRHGLVRKLAGGAITLVVTFLVFPLSLAVTLPFLALVLVGVLLIRKCGDYPTRRQRMFHRQGQFLLALACVFPFLGFLLGSYPLFVCYDGLGNPIRAKYLTTRAESQFGRVLLLTDPIRPRIAELAASLSPDRVFMVERTKRSGEEYVRFPLIHDINLDGGEFGAVPGTHYRWLCIPHGWPIVDFGLRSDERRLEDSKVMTIAVIENPAHLADFSYLQYPAYASWNEVGPVAGSDRAEAFSYVVLLALALREAYHGRPQLAVDLLKDALAEAPSSLERARVYTMMGLIMRTLYDGNLGRLQSLPMFNLAFAELHAESLPALSSPQSVPVQWIRVTLSNEYGRYPDCFADRIDALGFDSSRDFTLIDRQRFLAALELAAKRDNERFLIDAFREAFTSPADSSEDVEPFRKLFDGWRLADAGRTESLAESLSGDLLLAFFEQVCRPARSPFANVFLAEEEAVARSDMDTERIRMLRNHVGRLPRVWRGRYASLLELEECFVALGDELSSGEAPKNLRPFLRLFGTAGLKQYAAVFERGLLSGRPALPDTLLAAVARAPSESWYSLEFRDWFACRTLAIWRSARDSTGTTHQRLTQRFSDDLPGDLSTFLPDDVLLCQAKGAEACLRENGGQYERLLGAPLEDLLFGKREVEVKLAFLYMSVDSTSVLKMSAARAMFRDVRAQAVYERRLVTEVWEREPRDAGVSTGITGFLRRRDLRSELRAKVFDMALGEVSAPIYAYGRIFLVQVVERGGNEGIQSSEVDVRAGKADLRLRYDDKKE